MSSAIQIIPASSKKFPSLLTKISDPPGQLYARGNLDLLNHPHLLSVVGSRKASIYGKAAISQLLPPFIQKGGVVVSGLAFGIDSLSHQACTNLNSPTIAVLGSGIDDASITPRSNLRLALLILKENGLIISEYPAGTPAQKFTFPARNRIIAGLSPATLIVQASLKSGSLITARLALEYNRDVLAVPGPITDPLSAGTNNLIQHGAAPILTADNILSLYNMEAASSQATYPSAQLTTTQSLIISTLTTHPCDIDTISSKTNLTTQVVSPLLIELELLDLVEHVGHMQYVRKQM